MEVYKSRSFSATISESRSKRVCWLATSSQVVAFDSCYPFETQFEFRKPPRAKKHTNLVFRSPRKRQFPSAQDIETQTQLTSAELSCWEHCVKVTKDLLAAPKNGGLLPQNSPYRRSLLYFFSADMAHKEAENLFKVSRSSIQHAKKDRGEAMTSILYPPNRTKVRLEMDVEKFSKQVLSIFIWFFLSWPK